MAKFAKRHYEAIAQVMQGSKPLGGKEIEAVRWVFIRNDLGRMFEQDNGSFDRSRFERACEPGANVRARG